MQDIDFVITYLDGNDPQWQEEKKKYLPPQNADAGSNRYRNWDNLRYLFRGIEKYAPWVRKIHFITCGHVPEWLDTSNKKLNIVKHGDYIPKEWLPTFSSRCIDMNLHRIEELSERFVYFNDDMFLLKPCDIKDFFYKGLPRDCAILEPPVLTKRKAAALYLAPIIGTAAINSHFSKNKVIGKDPFKWFNPAYGRFNISTLFLMPYKDFAGFRPMHLPYSYLKSSYKSVWKQEPELCEAASSHKFRCPDDANHLIFSYWQFVTGRFYPRNVKTGKNCYIRSKKDADKAAEAILHSSAKFMCLNDNIDDPADAEYIIKRVNGALDKLLPDKSSFEKSAD